MTEESQKIVKEFLNKCSIVFEDFNQLDGMLIPRDLLLSKDKYEIVKDDIDKMHTYTHAIKNSKGSIVLFPGNENVRYDCLSTIVGALFCTPNEPQNLQDSLIKLFE